MRSILRTFVSVLCLLAICVPCRALDRAAVLDEQQLLQLEQRAEQANPRDQCFLYTELVSAMTERAGQQMRNGDPDQAAATLQKVSK